MENETRVLLEEIRKEVKTISAGQGIIVQKLEEHDTRFDALENKVDKIEQELKTVGNAVLEMHTDMKEILNNHEQRVTRLEEKAHA